MAPWPEQGNEPKAPDKEEQRESVEADVRLESDDRTDNNVAVSSRNDQNQDDKDVHKLDESQLKALLDEAVSYKNPKDREGKSELFKELLQEAEADESDSKGLTSSLGGKLPRAYYNLPARRRQSRHSNQNKECGVGVSSTRGGGSLQNLNALGMEGGRRSRKRDTLVSARQREGGSLPTNVNVDNEPDLDIICPNYTSRATLEVSGPENVESAACEEAPGFLKLQGHYLPNGNDSQTKEDDTRVIETVYSSISSREQEKKGQDSIEKPVEEDILLNDEKFIRSSPPVIRVISNDKLNINNPSTYSGSGLFYLFHNDDIGLVDKPNCPSQEGDKNKKRKKHRNRNRRPSTPGQLLESTESESVKDGGNFSNSPGKGTFQENKQENYCESCKMENKKKFIPNESMTYIESIQNSDGAEYKLPKMNDTFSEQTISTLNKIAQLWGVLELQDDSQFAKGVGPVESGAMLYPSTPVQHVSVLSIPPSQIHAASDDHRISDSLESKKLNVSRSQQKKAVLPSQSASEHQSEEADNSSEGLLGLPLTAYWNRYSSFTLLDLQDPARRERELEPQPSPSSGSLDSGCYYTDYNASSTSTSAINSRSVSRSRESGLGLEETTVEDPMLDPQPIIHISIPRNPNNLPIPEHLQTGKSKKQTTRYTRPANGAFAGIREASHSLPNRVTPTLSERKSKTISRRPTNIPGIHVLEDIDETFPLPNLLGSRIEVPPYVPPYTPSNPHNLPLEIPDYLLPKIQGSKATPPVTESSVMPTPRGTHEPSYSSPTSVSHPETGAVSKMSERRSKATPPATETSVNPSPEGTDVPSLPDTPPLVPTITKKNKRRRKVIPPCETCDAPIPGKTGVSSRSLLLPKSKMGSKSTSLATEVSDIPMCKDKAEPSKSSLNRDNHLAVPAMKTNERKSEPIRITKVKKIPFLEETEVSQSPPVPPIVPEGTRRRTRRSKATPPATETSVNPSSGGTDVPSLPDTPPLVPTITKKNKKGSKTTPPATESSVNRTSGDKDNLSQTLPFPDTPCPIPTITKKKTKKGSKTTPPATESSVNRTSGDKDNLSQTLPFPDTPCPIPTITKKKTKKGSKTTPPATESSVNRTSGDKDNLSQTLPFPDTPCPIPTITKKKTKRLSRTARSTNVSVIPAPAETNVSQSLPALASLLSLVASVLDKAPVAPPPVTKESKTHNTDDALRTPQYTPSNPYNLPLQAPDFFEIYPTASAHNTDDALSTPQYTPSNPDNVTLHSPNLIEPYPTASDVMELHSIQCDETYTPFELQEVFDEAIKRYNNNKKEFIKSEGFDPINITRHSSDSSRNEKKQKAKAIAATTEASGGKEDPPQIVPYIPYIVPRYVNSGLLYRPHLPEPPLPTVREDWVGELLCEAFSDEEACDWPDSSFVSQDLPCPNPVPPPCNTLGVQHGIQDSSVLSFYPQPPNPRDLPIPNFPSRLNENTDIYANPRMAFGNSTDVKTKPLDENGNALACVRMDANCLDRKKQRRVKAKNDRNTILSDEIEGFRGGADIDTLMKYIESPSLESSKGTKGRTNQANGTRSGVKVRAKEEEPRPLRRRKDKFQRCNSLEEISKTKLEDLTEENSNERVNGSSSHPLPKKQVTVDDTQLGKKSSWDEEEVQTSRAYESEKEHKQERLSPEPLQETEFLLVTKKQRRRKRRTGCSSRAGSKPNYYGRGESGSGRLLYQYRGDQGPTQTRRKSASSVPPSDKSDSSDLDSVHSLPVSSSTSRTQAGNNSVSGGSTPQASYADIARTASSPPDGSQVNIHRQEKSPNSSYVDSYERSSTASNTLPVPLASFKKDAMTDTNCDKSPLLTSKDYPPLESKSLDLCIDTKRSRNAMRDNVVPTDRVNFKIENVITARESGDGPLSLPTDSECITSSDNATKRPAVILMNEPTTNTQQVQEITFGFEVNHQLLQSEGQEFNETANSVPRIILALPTPPPEGGYYSLNTDSNLVQHLSAAWEETMEKVRSGKARYYDGQ